MRACPENAARLLEKDELIAAQRLRREVESRLRRLAIDFTVPDNQDIKLEFRGTALQGLTDESWGMDNVQVSYKVVPAPGAMGLAGLGGALLLGRRKR